MSDNYSATIYGLEFGDRIIYVGSTERSPAKRLSRHYSDAKSGKISPLYCWMREEMPLLRMKILEVCTSMERYERERHFIAFHDTITNGFNTDLTDRKGRPKGCVNPIGEDHYLYGKKVSRHIVDASVAARRGKHLSEEHKAKLRAAHVGREDQSTKVRCIDTGETFPSIAEAARIKNISTSSLLRNLNGANKTCGGLRFERI